MLKLVSFHIQPHLNAFLQILEYFSQSVDVDGLNLLAYNVFELFDCAGCIFVHFALSIGPKERSRQALDRLPLVSKFLTNFWMQHFDGALLSPNSIRNAVWHALNESVCQYLRTRNPISSTVYIDNSLGPLTRDSPCKFPTIFIVYFNEYFPSVPEWMNWAPYFPRFRLQRGKSTFTHPVGSSSNP